MSSAKRQCQGFTFDSAFVPPDELPETLDEYLLNEMIHEELEWRSSADVLIETVLATESINSSTESIELLESEPMKRSREEFTLEGEHIVDGRRVGIYQGITYVLCEIEGCFISPSHGDTKGQPLRCGSHATSSQFKITYVTCCECSEHGEIREATMQLKSDVSETKFYCGSCAERCYQMEAIPFSGKIERCIHPGCKRNPRFAPTGEQPRHCSIHCQVGEVLPHRTLCRICFRLEATHGERPSPTSPSGKILRCGKHKFFADINFRKRLCEGPNCSLQATFRMEGGIARWCSAHRPRFSYRLR